MRKIMKRTAVICMAFVMMLTMMPIVGFNSFADSEFFSFTVGDYDYQYDHGSVYISKYNGKDTQIVIPASVTYNGKTYNDFYIGNEAFKGKTTLQKVAIPSSCEAIMNESFAGCTSLTEVAIEGDNVYFGNDTFSGCSNLKTYRINGAFDEEGVKRSGIGRDTNGKVYDDVTVYTTPGSNVAKAIGASDGSEAGTINGNSKSDGNGKFIKVVTQDNPYAGHTVTPSSGGGSGGSGGSSSGMGEDGTAYGAGASESVVDKAITKYAKEKDPKGTSFGLLQARLKTAKKNSITLQWKSVKGAKKYIVYGNACGTKNKLKKMVKKTTKTKMSFKKVAGKKVKAGKPYKFVIVAIDKNGKVISTSKIVHAATKGGTKWVNAKSVTTKAKKNKVTLKKGKKFSLKAKTVAEKGKGKLINHRGISYETSNKKVATVNSKGVITAKGKGTCTIYAYAHNGVFKAIKVTVN